VKTIVGGERGYVGGILIDRAHKPSIRRVQRFAYKLKIKKLGLR
jgi:hypothetical protein